MASPVCHDLIAPALNLQATSQSSLLEGAIALVAMQDRTTRVGQLTYSVSYDETRLEIKGVKVEEKYQRQGVNEFLMRAALERNPEVTEVEAEYVQTNAEVVRAELARGSSLNEAILKAPTSRTLIKLGNRKNPRQF